MEKRVLSAAVTGVIIVNMIVTGFLLINSKTRPHQSVNEISQRYLSYYHSGKVSKLESFWADNIEFKDETARIAGESLMIKGKQNVKSQLIEVFASVESLSFTRKFGFTSGDFTVSAGTISYQMPVSKDTKTKVSFDVVTILEFKEGKVLKHADYADYQSLINQLNK